MDEFIRQQFELMLSDWGEPLELLVLRQRLYPEVQKLVEETSRYAVTGIVVDDDQASRPSLPHSTTGAQSRQRTLRVQVRQADLPPVAPGETLHLERRGKRYRVQNWDHSHSIVLLEAIGGGPC